MKYYSTNRRVPTVDLAGALLQGQAADKGLFLPDSFPRLDRRTLRSLVGKSYAEVAEAILSPYTEGMLTSRQLRDLCRDAYDYEVPLERVTDRRYVMRLDRGPTASFKDFAARMMARWMSVLMERERGELVILTATSGDTGSAVAHAYLGVPRVKVVVLFPVTEVSERQRKQMTTLGQNVFTIGIEGKFDDGQAMVKRAFADPALDRIRLTSANSINIGRLLPQAVYYFWAWLQLADVAAMEQAVFSVPSGNFGDMMGGIIARKMGLPIRRLVIATNSNDEVPRFLETGRYDPIVPSRVCISNAMNVGHPSNLARLVDLYGGRMDEVGKLHKSPDMAAMRSDLYAVSIDERETRTTIRDAWREHRLLLEPHGAVGWAGLKRYLDGHGGDSPASLDGHGGDSPASLDGHGGDDDALCVSLETAHPAKFPDEVKAITGVDPELPPSLVGLEARPEQYPVMPVDYDAFRDLLLDRYA
jgi:threonine synthase